MRQAITLAQTGVVQPLVLGGRSPHGYRRLIFLVHGFNNDVGESAVSYSAMRRQLDAILRDAGRDERRRRAIQETIWEFHWPGYYARASTKAAGTPRTRLEAGVTAATYFLQVVKARGYVADALAQYCTTLGQVEVGFVAHSLGCRVVLETVKRLADTPGHTVNVTGAVLMAGAVPVQFLVPYGRFRQSAGNVARRYAFYSRRDRVLLIAFPPGQALAGELAPFAVGLTGWPKGLWNAHRNTGFGHGAYWKDALKLPSDDTIASVLSGMFLVTAERQLPVTAALEGGPAEETFLPGWRLAERRLTGADWLEDLCVPEAPAGG